MSKSGVGRVSKEHPFPGMQTRERFAAIKSPADAGLFMAAGVYFFAAGSGLSAGLM